MKRNNLTRKRRKITKRGMRFNYLLLTHLCGKQRLIKGHMSKTRALFNEERGHK